MARTGRGDGRAAAGPAVVLFVLAAARRALLRARVLAGLVLDARVAVAGGSMEPTLRPGDRVLVSRLAYRLRRPAPGEVVLLRDPVRPGLESLKRVVAGPGERVRLAEGRLWVDGRALCEPYLAPGRHGEALGELTWTLGPDTYLVLGDHRDESRDSRHYGPVRREHLLGPAWYRYAPAGARGPIPVPPRRFHAAGGDGP